MHTSFMLNWFKGFSFHSFIYSCFIYKKLPRIDVPKPTMDAPYGKLRNRLHQGPATLSRRNQRSEFSLAVSPGQCDASRDAMVFSFSSLGDEDMYKIQLYLNEEINLIIELDFVEQY